MTTTPPTADNDGRSRLMKLGLVALALGLFAVTAAGCGGDDETAPPAETATTAPPATEPFTYEPPSAAEVALANIERAGTPEGLVPPVRVIRQMLIEMRKDCRNTREELAGYTLRAIDVLRDAGVELLPTDVLLVVSTTAVRAGGIDCRRVFAKYVTALRG